MANGHPIFLAVGPRLWPGVARVKGVARGGHLNASSLFFHVISRNRQLLFRNIISVREMPAKRSSLNSINN